jgi:Flp pilus assembly protein TadD
MKAAALNIKGIVAMDLNQESNAKNFFNQALQLFPDFALAKGNLATLAQKDTKTTGTGSAAPKTTPVPKPAGK